MAMNNRKILSRLARLRPLVEAIAFWTQSPEEIIKQSELTTRQQMWQRNVARSIVEYFTRLTNAFGSIEILVIAAREDLRRLNIDLEKQTTAEGEEPVDVIVTAAVIALLLSRTEEIPIDKLEEGLAFVGRNSVLAASEAMGLGSKLPAEWDLPEIALAASFPAIAAAIKTRIAQGQEAFVSRSANGIIRAAGSSVAIQQAVENAEARIQFLLVSTSTERTKTLSNQVANEVRQATFIKNGIEQKRWITVAGTFAAGLSPVDPICLRNAAAGWIGIREAYPSGHQSPLAHRNCRCVEQGRVVDNPQPTELTL